MRKLVSVTLPVLAIASIACGPSLPELGKGELPQPPSTGDAFPGVKCSAVRPQTEPDLMGWDSGSRANLNSLRRQGVIAVRYDAKGCNVELEVLSNCIGKGSYAYEPYPSRDTKLARNASELFAELPLGAARLSGRIKGGRALRTDYMLAGVASLPAGAMFARTNLSGPDCAKATHVISKVYLGGFGMFAGEATAIEAQASLFGAGAGGSTEAQAERVAMEGNPDACETAQKDGNENKLCAVPLRIGLLALEALAQPPAAAQGPATAPTPSVPPPRPKDPPPIATSGGDRDGDGIVDSNDKCPDMPEDRDGFEDSDGCPDPDNDRDKIADVQDQCPNDPETYNGKEDEDGCPDTMPVTGTASAIVIKERVAFDPGSSKIPGSAHAILKAVAVVLKANPLLRVVVEGHTDSQGTDAYNQALSEQRARAVVDHLAGQGVERSRLSSRGYGETKPIASNQTAEGRAQNNRVEFVVAKSRASDGGF